MPEGSSIIDLPVHGRVLLPLGVVKSPRNGINQTITASVNKTSPTSSLYDVCKDSQVGIAEVSNAVPARMHVLLRRLWRFDNTVLGALDGIIRPAGQEIRCVHDDGVFDRCGVDESAFRREDLQAAGHVLEEERDGAVVGVSARSHSPLILLELACRARRVVQESVEEE